MTDEFYNATTLEALDIIRDGFKRLKEQGVQHNYGVMQAAMVQIERNERTPSDVTDKADGGELVEVLERCLEWVSDKYTDRDAYNPDIAEQIKRLLLKHKTKG